MGFNLRDIVVDSRTGEMGRVIGYDGEFFRIRFSFGEGPRVERFVHPVNLLLVERV